jgi:protein-tyrosine kinase
MNAPYAPYTPQQLRAAPAVEPARRRMLGEILVDNGRLLTDDVMRVLTYQQDKGVSFGEAAVRLRLVNRGDVQQALSQQFEYPVLVPGHGGFSRELVSAYEPFGATAEAIRKLRTELMLRWFDDARRVLAITSPDRYEGRSYLSANLAVSFAQQGANTLLIDADLRCSALHRLFGVPNRSGLSTLLGNPSVKPTEAIFGFSDLPNLSLLPAGSLPPNPLELLGQPAFSRLLSQLAMRFDVVLIDTPAAARNADAQLCASRAGGALVVARRNRSQHESLRALMQSIAASGTTIVGTTFNQA